METDFSDAAAVYPGIMATSESWVGSSPRASVGGVGWLKSRFQTSGFQNCEAVSFCYLMPPICYNSHRKQITHLSSTLLWSPKGTGSCSSVCSWWEAWWVMYRCSVHMVWAVSGKWRCLQPPLLDGLTWWLWPRTPLLSVLSQQSSPVEDKHPDLISLFGNMHFKNVKMLEIEVSLTLYKLVNIIEAIQ